jgi:hypothetical protein
MLALTVINHPPSIESGSATISCGPPGVGMVRNTIPFDSTGWAMILRRCVFQSSPMPSNLVSRIASYVHRRFPGITDKAKAENAPGPLPAGNQRQRQLGRSTFDIAAIRETLELAMVH